MDVYVESHFVLELVFAQEERDEASALLEIAEDGVELAIPAFSLVEPLTTILGRGKHRAALADGLSEHLDQLRRSGVLQEDVERADFVPVLLAGVQAQQLDEFERVSVSVAGGARILALDGPTLTSSFELQRDLDLGPSDALVLAAVLRDRQERETTEACFVTGDQHFSARRVRERIETTGIRVIPTYSDGVAFVSARI